MKTKENKKNNPQILIDTITQTKEALLRSWKDNKECFLDNDKLTSEGVLSESIGLTSILLILVAFNQREECIAPYDRTKFAEIIDKSIAKIHKTITQNGFVATPLISVEASSRIFTPQNGYMDTVSWVLSASVLCRYAEANKMIKLSPSTHNCVFELIALALKQLIQGQRNDGTWGFLAEPHSKKALYFTYAAGVSLGDFFDYILGEIEEVEKNNDSSQKTFKDSELLDYLDAHLNMNVATKVEEMREKLSSWLLTDALPLLPKLASCQKLIGKDLEQLGLWQDPYTSKSSDVNYYNLYYTYYLIDLIVLSATDIRYSEMIANPTEQNKAFLSNLRAQIKARNNLREEDYRYYFVSFADHGEDFLNDYLEQAIHDSRNQYMNATRTGKTFWDSKASELQLKFEHDDPDINAIIEDDFTTDDGKSIFTDPAIIPMALRVNALYSYYICDQADIAVENLFEAITNNIANSADLANPKCISGLWDQQSYSLLVTERSIEALVDYYDYLNKVTKEAISSGADLEKSPFELSFERKIKEYLQSDEGQKLLSTSKPSTEEELHSFLETDAGRDAIKNAISSDKSILSDYFSSEEGQERLNELIQKHTSKENSTDKSFDPAQALFVAESLQQLTKQVPFVAHSDRAEEKLLEQLVTTLVQLENYTLYNRVNSSLSRLEEETDVEYSRRVSETTEIIQTRLEALFECLIGDVNKSVGDLQEMYQTLRDKL